MTARHCLQTCLITNGVFKEQPHEGVPWYKLDGNKLGHARCPVNINKSPRELQIEATSPFMILPRHDRSFKILNPSHYEELAQLGALGQGDYVIAKILNESPVEISPLTTSNLAEASTQVWTAGFPAQTQRENHRNSDGNQMYFSQGVILETILENSCINSFLTLHPNTPPHLRTELIKRFDENSAFVSDIDSFHGSSGSPVFNQKGELIGLLTNMYDHSFLTRQASDQPHRLYCQGSSKALKIETIKLQLDRINIPLNQWIDPI